MELIQKVEFVKFVTSDVLLVLDQPLIVSHVLLTRFSTKVDAGQLVLLFPFKE